jgi:O-antigen ligase
MKKTASLSKQALSVQPNYLRTWRILFGLMLGAASLFFWPSCLDRFLAPRFLFATLVFFWGIWALRKEILEKGDHHFHFFDALMFGWYGWNIAASFWAFSLSEAVFFTQKSFLLLLSYWFTRQLLFLHDKEIQNTLQKIIQLLSWLVAAILLVQLALAISSSGLQNDLLYDQVSGVFGNKSLATDFLFILLICNVYFNHNHLNKWVKWGLPGMLLLLIILLQTRTVYVATALAALLYVGIQFWQEPSFRKRYKKWVIPALLLLVALAGWLRFSAATGSTLAERLNPFTYASSISANERKFVWYKTDLLNKEHPLLGVGNGSWKFLFPSKNIQGAYRLQEQNIVFTRVHNDYLEVRAEMGILGAIWFVLIFVFAGAAVFRALPLQENEKARHEASVLLSGLLGYCVIQYFDFPRERIELQVFLGFLLGLMAWNARVVWQKRQFFLNKVSVSMMINLFMASLLLSIVVGWYRVQGEIHTVIMLKAQAKQDYNTMEKEAAAACNTWYEYDDVALPLQYHRGTACFHLNRMAESEAYFQQAYELNPWSFAVINNYATALSQNGQYGKAIPLLEKTIEINPKFDEGKLNLAYAWMELGDFQKSMEWVNRVDTIINPSNDIDRRKNSITKARQNEFLKMLRERMK